jgi:hypothetical protein
MLTQKKFYVKFKLQASLPIWYTNFLLFEYLCMHVWWENLWMWSVFLFFDISSFIGV